MWYKIMPRNIIIYVLFQQVTASIPKKSLASSSQCLASLSYSLDAHLTTQLTLRCSHFNKSKSLRLDSA